MPRSKAVVKQSAQKRRRQLISDSEDDEQKSVPGGLKKDFEGTQFRKRVFGNPNLTAGINQSRVSDETNIREAVKGPVKTRDVTEKSEVGSKRPAQPGMGGKEKRRRLILSYDSEEDEPLTVPEGHKKETGLATLTSDVSSVEAIQGKNKVVERWGADVRAAKRLSVSGFAKDDYGIGGWEKKELVSRDGQMRLSGDVLMASIDQRSVSGESACAALVAVIADFLHTNPGRMPTKSQFDCLIHLGSLEWRKLCQNKTYIERFPNRHFDLDTILEAKIRPMSIVSEESHFGFFRPKPAIDNSQLEFLEAFKSFDEMWDDIRRAATECSTDGFPLLYIVSWNDHFFVLKVEHNAYYLVDTLGERLHEGCKQGYILKFDESTMIYKIRENSEASETEMTKYGSHQVLQKVGHAEEEVLVSGGKESCKEYIKSFLAAIPIRDLEADIKRGPVASELLHRRLQIELHYTKASKISEQL